MVTTATDEPLRAPPAWLTQRLDIANWYEARGLPQGVVLAWLIVGTQAEGLSNLAELYGIPWLQIQENAITVEE